MRVRAEDVCLMMQHVFNVAIALLKDSQQLSDEMSLVRTARLAALQRSLEDVVTIYKTYEEDQQQRFRSDRQC